MNCQNCGAENEPGARFCAECGTPLEDLRGATQPLEDNDHTILSTASQLAEEAKTVSVTQDEVAAAAAEMETDPPYEDDEPTMFSSGPEMAPAPPPPPESPPPAGGNSGNGGFMSQRNIIIIAVVVLLVLCCCCFFIVLGVVLGSGDMDQILNDLNLTLLAPYQYFG